MLFRSALIATLAVLAPVAAYAQTKPTMTIVNPVSNPVNTRITNEVVPVTISNADPIPVQVEVQQGSVATPLDRFLSIQMNVGANGGSSQNDVYVASAPIQITGVTLQMNAGATAEACSLSLWVYSPSGAFLTSLASVYVTGGRSLASPHVQVPNLLLPAGHAVRYRLANLSGSGTCDGNLNLYLVSP